MAKEKVRAFLAWEHSAQESAFDPNRHDSIVTRQWMGKQFEEHSAKGEKVGEQTKEQVAALASQQNLGDDTSCVATDSSLGAEEEGQGAAAAATTGKNTEKK